MISLVIFLVAAIFAVGGAVAAVRHGYYLIGPFARSSLVYGTLAATGTVIGWIIGWMLS
jgi:hypothetical protein